jgi:hypothetical protein
VPYVRLVAPLSVGAASAVDRVKGLRRKHTLHRSKRQSRYFRIESNLTTIKGLNNGPYAATHTKKTQAAF